MCECDGMRAADLALYLVLDPGLCGDRDRGPGMVETARLAVAGGVTLVQLRDKEGGTVRLIETGRALTSALESSGVKLIVNDDAEAAMAIGADGLHIGQGDLTAAEARALIGPDAILGLSVGTPEQANRIDPALVDYVGAGPVFATPTKPGHAPPVGFEGLAALVAASPVPVVAIGGLKARHVGQALAAGASGVAVVSAICGQSDPEAAARGLKAEVSAMTRSS